MADQQSIRQGSDDLFVTLKEVQPHWRRNRALDLRLQCQDTMNVRCTSLCTAISPVVLPLLANYTCHKPGPALVTGGGWSSISVTVCGVCVCVYVWVFWNRGLGGHAANQGKERAIWIIHVLGAEPYRPPSPKHTHIYSLYICVQLICLSHNASVALIS